MSITFQLDEHNTLEAIWIYDTKHSTNLPIASDYQNLMHYKDVHNKVISDKRQ
jgi:hypothetical protein